MEAVVLHRAGFLAYFCPKQGQDFKPSAAPLYPHMGQVPPDDQLKAKVEKYHRPANCGKVVVPKVTRRTFGASFLGQHERKISSFHAFRQT